MSKKKKSIINMVIITIAVITVGLFIALIFSFNGGSDKNVKKSDLRKEDREQGIINANKKAINSAKEQKEGTIKPISAEDHILGPLDAPVQFIVYSDFECPFCADFSDTVRQVIKKFGDKVVVAFRQFPLTATDPNSMEAAVASECAAEQGKFWEMHDKLYADNTEKTFNANQFKKDAADIGLEGERFNKCLDEEKYKDKIEAQISEGKNVGILGAPQSYVNGQPLPGAYPFENFTDSQKHKRIGMKNIILKHLEEGNK